MKKSAVFLFDGFCNFETACLLEIFALNQKEVTFFGTSLDPIKCEEKMSVIADMTLDQCNIDDYDCLVISGSYWPGLKNNLDNQDVLDFIRLFNDHHKVIAAISSTPLLLCKAGVLKDKQYIAGILKSDFLPTSLTKALSNPDVDPEYLAFVRESTKYFNEDDLTGLIDMDKIRANDKDNIPTPKYVIEDNIITGVAWHFREWSVALAKILNLETYAKTFGDDLL